MGPIPLSIPSEAAKRAYRQFAAMTEMAEAILQDLADQIPGDFDPQNQYITAYNLGQYRTIQRIELRMAQARQTQEQYPEAVTHGQE